jgi:GntR family transcriptional regulator
MLIVIEAFMSIQWNDEQPIYRQLEAHVKSLILESAINEGEALPSVRLLAMEFTLNPITVSKAIQELVHDGLIEKKRGLGMFVVDGARARLLEQERLKFIKEEWPQVKERIEMLELSVMDLLGEVKND